jgi:hypothetical protein
MSEVQDEKVARCGPCHTVTKELIVKHPAAVAHVFEGHPDKVGVWQEHWKLRRVSYLAFGADFDEGALKQYGNRPSFKDERIVNGDPSFDEAEFLEATSG